MENDQQVIWMRRMIYCEPAKKKCKQEYSVGAFGPVRCNMTSQHHPDRISWCRPFPISHGIHHVGKKHGTEYNLSEQPRRHVHFCLRVQPMCPGRTAQGQFLRYFVTDKCPGTGRLRNRDKYWGGSGRQDCVAMQAGVLRNLSQAK